MSNFWATFENFGGNFWEINFPSNLCKSLVIIIYSPNYTNKLDCINLIGSQTTDNSGRNINKRSSGRKLRNIKSNRSRQIRRHGYRRKGGNLQAEPQGRAGGSTPKGGENRTPPKIKKIKGMGSEKEKQREEDTWSLHKGLTKRAFWCALHK